MITIGKYRVRRINSLNLLLEEKAEITSGKNKGTETYKELGFYDNYTTATSSIVSRMIAEHTPDEDDSKINTARAVNRKLDEVHRLVLEEIKATIEYVKEETADAERKSKTAEND